MKRMMMFQKRVKNKTLGKLSYCQIKAFYKHHSSQSGSDTGKEASNRHAGPLTLEHLVEDLSGVNGPMVGPMGPNPMFKKNNNKKCVDYMGNHHRGGDWYMIDPCNTCLCVGPDDLISPSCISCLEF